MKMSYFKCDKCGAIVEYKLPVDDVRCERCDNKTAISYQPEMQDKLCSEFKMNCKNLQKQEK